jgi:hypothetical protein
MKERRKDCKYCGKYLTEGQTNKQFCCDLHRVYWHRENPKVKVTDLTKPTNQVKVVEPNEVKTNSTINTAKEGQLSQFEIYRRKKLGIK